MYQYIHLFSLGDVGLVINDVKEVVNYYGLGLYLNVLPSTLDQIEEKHKTVERRRIEVIKAWLVQSCHPCWEQLVSALCDIEEFVIARKIQEKHLSSKSGKV